MFNNPYAYCDPRGESIGGYLLGLGEIVLGGTIMVGGFALEVVSFGGFTFGFGVIEGAGLSLIGHGLSMTAQHAQDVSFSSYSDRQYNFDLMGKRSSAPRPDPRAEGHPHTIIERPGSGGQYTTHNGDGTFGQYRGSGKPHGGIPRPNVKENKLDNSPKGPIPGRPAVRPARPDEIPKGK